MLKPPLPKIKTPLTKRRQMLRRCVKAFQGPVELILHDNTHVFINIVYRKKKWWVRLHWMFLHATEAMAHHIAQYTFYRNRKSSRLIDQYIEDHWHWVNHPIPEIRTQGRYFNLQTLVNQLNRRYLKGKVDAKVTWGRAVGKRSYEQLQMGSYSTSRNLITIHPHLDQKFVPRIVVEATLFHEMCHALVPVVKVGRRRQIHPPTFQKLEICYPHLRAAQEWEAKNLKRLFRVPGETGRRRRRKQRDRLSS